MLRRGNVFEAAVCSQINFITSVTSMFVCSSCIPRPGLFFPCINNANFPRSSSPARAQASRALHLQRVTSNGLLCDVTMSLVSNASMDLLSLNQVEKRNLHMAAVSNLSEHHRSLV